MAFDRGFGMCYGSIALFSAILHNMFLLYHIETFVSIYKIDKMSFWVGETIFLVWNSFNDPLFGWISDKGYLFSNKKEVASDDVVFRRLQALSWYGPLFGVAFLLFWVSWTFPALQFILCLCLYDGFLTMIDLHHSALLADLAVSATARTRLNFYCSIFNAVGSVSVFLSYAVWNRDDMKSFQIFCVLLTIFSIAGFVYSTRYLKRHYRKRHKSNGESSDTQEYKKSSSVESLQEGLTVSDAAALKAFVGQLYNHKNFLWFASMNLVQVFHCHFNSNFFPLFLENLLGDIITPTTGSLILGISFIAPHINNLYFLSLCQRYGVYRVIKYLFYVKLSLSAVMLVVGPSHTWLLCLFVASNRVFTEGTCKLLNLVISDLVDEDYVLHSRKQVVSALMFGTTALVSKPGQTLAPLIGIWLLSVQTGHDVFQSGNTLGSIKLAVANQAPGVADMYRLGCFHLLVYIPIGCAILQLIAWSKFTLHGKRLQWVKAVRAGAEYATV